MEVKIIIDGDEIASKLVGSVSIVMSKSREIMPQGSNSFIKFVKFYDGVGIKLVNGENVEHIGNVIPMYPEIRREEKAKLIQDYFGA